MTRTRAFEATRETAEWPGYLDPASNPIVFATGRKGSGKSTFNRRLYASWPGDKLCIDVNGEADPGADAIPLRDPLPPSWPARADGEKGPQNLHYKADPGSATYVDDLDRAVGTALFPQDHRVLVWCGEVGEFTTGAKTQPHMRRLLMQNRHYKTAALFDGPRPMDIDKLVIAQADLVAVFDLPDPADRERVAKVIGYPPALFAAELDETRRRGPHWYLLYASRDGRLYRCPPLPA